MSRGPDPDQPQSFADDELADVQNRYSPDPLGEYHPPEGVVPSTLDVVESFFGSELNEDVIRAVRTLPSEQANELSSRISDFTRGAAYAFNSRQSDLRLSKSWLKHLETFTLANGKLASLDQRARYSTESWKLLSAGYGIPSPFYENIVHGQIHMHESLVLEDDRIDLANRPALKHLALYCDRVVIRDPLNIPCHGVRRLDQFADGLRQLLPLAGLVRTGCFVLSRFFHREWLITYAESPIPPRVRNNTVNPLSLTDPFTNWIARHHKEQIIQARKHSSITDPDDQWFIDTLLPLYPFDISASELRTIVEFSEACRAYDLRPITSSPGIARHLEESTRALLDGRPELSSRVAGNLAMSPVVSYGVPSLSEVSFADIASLRANEAVFAEVRSSLAELDKVCAQYASPDSYESFKRAVHDNAADIVRPACERLTAMQYKAKAWQLAGVGIGKLVSFGIHAAGNTGYTPGVGHIAGPAGNVVRKAIGKKAGRTHEDAEVGLGILKSINLY